MKRSLKDILFEGWQDKAIPSSVKLFICLILLLELIAIMAMSKLQ